MELISPIKAISNAVSFLGARLLGGFERARKFLHDRAETEAKIKDRHRELWRYYEEHPEIHALKAATRDMLAHPLTSQERAFVARVLDHLALTRSYEKAGSYVQPEALPKDIKNFFSLPAMRTAWEELKEFHNHDLVRFVERQLNGKTLVARNIWLRTSEGCARNPNNALVGSERDAAR